VGQGQGVSEEQPQPYHFKAGENIVKKTAKATQSTAAKTSTNIAGEGACEISFRLGDWARVLHAGLANYFATLMKIKSGLKF
jgi:hypothetical protein